MYFNKFLNKYYFSSTTGYLYEKNKCLCTYIWASLMASLVKDLSAMQETQFQSLGQEECLEKEMATHSSIFPGKSQGQRSLEGHIVHGVTRGGHHLVTRSPYTYIYA